MSIRRETDPQITQAIWEAIKVLIHQKSLPSSDRILRHLARVLSFNDFAAQNELKKALKDGLIECKKVLLKTSNSEQESYRFPSERPVDDGHDWYCYECHQAGEVESCKTCHRVFHAECYESVANSTRKICMFCEQSLSDVYKSNNDLSYILTFVCQHLKEKLPPVICDRNIVLRNKLENVDIVDFANKTWQCDGEDKWRPDILVYRHMDLTIMELKVEFKLYKNLSEFQADAHNILHNIIVYHGEESLLAKMANNMYTDCCYDLQEIRRCCDCYCMSNEKPEKSWYCIPCNPPHELVFAKQKGYSYWPAKVMQINNDIYDVRFFGGYHSRANIEKSHIKPITADVEQLQIKKTTTWNKAFAELKLHQQMLNDLGDESNSGETSPIVRDLRIKVERINPVVTKQNGVGSPKSEEPQEDVPCLNCNNSQMKTNNSEMENHVTSSCPEQTSSTVSIQTDPMSISPSPKQIRKERQQAERNHALALESLRRELETKKRSEIEKLEEDHAKAIKELLEKQDKIISEVKKRQWCYNCESEAIYHCCWNTAYCSTDCQQVHWQREHKRVCRRKK